MSFYVSYYPYVCSLCFYFFFFKQKTAYEMRISDWSSDVCSSDLFIPPSNPLVHAHFGAEPPAFGKIVYGMPGDKILHRGSDVIVSWEAGPHGDAPSERVVGKLKPLSSRGEKLEAGPTGVIQIGRASCRERVWQYV